MLTVYAGLAGRIRRSRYLANISENRWTEALAEHEAILATLEARDGATLGQLLKEHLSKTCETVKQALREDQAEDAPVAKRHATAGAMPPGD